MAVYDDLLVAVCEEEERRLEGCDFEVLVADLGQRRRALTGLVSPLDPYDVVEQLTRQLAYDAVLLVLGRRLGIDTGPRAFAVPGSERSRLEHLLARSGVIDLPTDPSPEVPAPEGAPESPASEDPAPEYPAPSAPV